MLSCRQHDTTRQGTSMKVVNFSIQPGAWNSTTILGKFLSGKFHLRSVFLRGTLSKSASNPLDKQAEQRNEMQDELEAPNSARKRKTRAESANVMKSDDSLGKVDNFFLQASKPFFFVGEFHLRVVPNLQFDLKLFWSECSS